MKNLFKFSILAAFTMLFAACQEELAPQTPAQGETKTITVTVDAQMTKTTLNTGRTGLQWEVGDNFGYFNNGTNATANAAVEYTEGASTYTLTVPADATEIYAYYPYYSSNSSKTANAINLGMNAQIQSAGGVFTGKDYPMTAKATIEGNTAALKFAPIASAVAFNVYNTESFAEGEAVKSISLVTAETETSCGYTEYNLTTGEFTGTHKYNDVKVTLTTPVPVGDKKPAEAQMYENQIYLMVHKGTYTNATLTVETSANITYTFTGVNLDCTKDIVSMNLNLSKGTTPPVVTVEPLAIPATETLTSIAPAEAPQYISTNVAETYSSDKGWKMDKKSTETGGCKYIQFFVDKAVGSVKVVGKMNSAIGGLELLASADGISFTSLGQKDVNGSAGFTFDFLNTDNTYRYFKLVYNKDSGNLSIYSVEFAELDNTPKISAGISSLDVVKEGETSSFTYSLVNADYSAVSVAVPEADQTWILADKGADGEVGYIIDANTTTSTRTSSITISVTGGEPVVIPVEQAGRKPTVSITGGNSVSLEADVTGTKTIEYTLDDVVAETVTVTPDEGNGAWFTYVSAADGLITYTVEANETSTPRSAKLYVSLENGNNVTVTITQAGVVEAGATWTLVTDVSTLAAGDQVIIAASNSEVALSTTQNKNNRGQASITKNGNVLETPGADVQVLTLGKTDATWTFNTGSGYLYAAGGTGKNNHLKTQETLSDPGYWTITIDTEGTATIKTNDSTVARHTMRYNSGNSCFACYASGQNDISIYKLTK